MSDENQVLVIPAFGKSQALKLEMDVIKLAESRIHEAQRVNPVTYVELEHTFNGAYRDLKRHLSAIGFQLTQADKALESAKADIILGSYAEFTEGKPASFDNADKRKAFMMRDEAYVSALDRVNQLKALESLFDGKIKVIENVCRYMRKQMDLVLRSGSVNSNLYITSGK